MGLFTFLHNVSKWLSSHVTIVAEFRKVHVIELPREQEAGRQHKKPLGKKSSEQFLVSHEGTSSRHQIIDDRVLSQPNGWINVKIPPCVQPESRLQKLNVLIRRSYGAHRGPVIAHLTTWNVWVYYARNITLFQWSFLIKCQLLNTRNRCYVTSHFSNRDCFTLNDAPQSTNVYLVI